MFERWLHREIVPAIHEKDIETVIRQLGLFDKINSREYSCSQCGESINLNNIQCIYKENDEVKICCDNIDCYKAVLDKREQQINEH